MDGCVQHLPPARMPLLILPSCSNSKHICHCIATSPSAPLFPPFFPLLPARYFIKLVKRKYKKDVSTDIRALQASAPVSAVCYSCRCGAPAPAQLHTNATTAAAATAASRQSCCCCDGCPLLHHARVLTPFPLAHPGCCRSCAARPSAPSAPCPPSTRCASVAIARGLLRACLLACVATGGAEAGPSACQVLKRARAGRQARLLCKLPKCSVWQCLPSGPSAWRLSC